MRQLLDLEGESASGEEVIRRILTMRVDLLYNGGIGTYIKSDAEEDAEVGDRANDRVRVDGKEVRARVLGEGGNLGLTQRGRLEYWASGGALNTDAIDNSAGVDTSDHEVNIKILMSLLIKKGAVKGREERNRILAEMTDEVADAGARGQREPGALPHPRRHPLGRALRGVRRRSSRTWWAPGSLNRADDADPHPRGAARLEATASAACRARCWPCCSATRRCGPRR